MNYLGFWSFFLKVCLFFFQSLDLGDHLSNTGLQETRCGLWKTIHLLYLHLTQPEKPMSIWYLSHLMKTLRGSGLTGCKLDHKKILFWFLYMILVFHFSMINCYCSCFSFEFHLRVSLALDGNLTLISRVRNINSKPFSFSIAYHTYFSISDIRWNTECSLSSLYELHNKTIELNAFSLFDWDLSVKLELKGWKLLTILITCTTESGLQSKAMHWLLNPRSIECT